MIAHGRASLRLLLSLWLLLPLQAFAFSMQDLVVNSLPGKPLRAHIPIKLDEGESLTELQVRLADEQEYGIAGIPYTLSLKGMQLALVLRGEGQARLKLFGEQPWQGEEAVLLFYIHWPGGLRERRYTIAAVDKGSTSSPRYVEVMPNESLAQIAMRLSEGSNRSYLYMMYALFQANPDAFYKGNMNNLKTGSTLRVPTEEELYRLNDAEVYRTVRRQQEQWQEGVPQADTTHADAAELNAQAEAMRLENEQLRQRLTALEQRLQNVAGQVLEYAETETETPREVAIAAPAEQPQQAPTEEAPAAIPEAVEEGPQKKAEEDSEQKSQGLGPAGMFGSVVLVLMLAYFIWYAPGNKRRGRD